MMKRKLLSIALLITSLGFLGSTVGTQADAATKLSNPQIRIQIGRRHRRDRFFYDNTRVETESRIVDNGWRRYREVYQVRYFPDGSTQTTVISRQRID